MCDMYPTVSVSSNSVSRLSLSISSSANRPVLLSYSLKCKSQYFRQSLHDQNRLVEHVLESLEGVWFMVIQIGFPPRGNRTCL